MLAHCRGTAPASQAKKPPAKRARKRKIRVEDLKVCARSAVPPHGSCLCQVSGHALTRERNAQEKDAIAEVFYHFPDRFARRFKGKGHEVGPVLVSLQASVSRMRV